MVLADDRVVRLETDCTRGSLRTSFQPLHSLWKSCGLKRALYMLSLGVGGWESQMDREGFQC